MKARVSLKEQSIKEAIVFFKKNHKNAESPLFNMDACIEELTEKALENGTHYELRSHETKSGHPETISFLKTDFNYTEIED